MTSMPPEAKNLYNQYTKQQLAEMIVALRRESGELNIYRWAMALYMRFSAMREIGGVEFFIVPEHPYELKVHSYELKFWLDRADQYMKNNSLLILSQQEKTDGPNTN